MDMLVGDDGRVWNPYSFEFIKHLGYYGGDYNMVAYAVRNLGFAAMQIRPRYTMIRLRPSLFPRACLDRIIELIIFNDVKRVVIDRVGLQAVPLDVMGNSNDAIARLQLLQQATVEKGAPFAPNIMSLSLDRLDHPKRAGMKAALAAWKATRGYTRSGDTELIAENPVYGGGGMVWMPGNDRCLVHAWPKPYKLYDDKADERYLGWDMTDLPDAGYIEPTSRSFFTSVHNRAPRLELIEALISHPDGSKFWSRYERLVLPWRTRSSDCFVSSVPLLRAVRPY